MTDACDALATVSPLHLPVCAPITITIAAMVKTFAKQLCLKNGIFKFSAFK